MSYLHLQRINGISQSITLKNYRWTLRVHLRFKARLLIRGFSKTAHRLFLEMRFIEKPTRDSDSAVRATLPYKAAKGRGFVSAYKQQASESV